MEMMHHAISWFEIPVTDFERARKFYSAIYDFEMPVSEMGANKMGFFLFDMQKQGIGGSIVQGEGYSPSRDGCKIYLNGGRDLQVVLNRVEAAGGQIIMQKTQISEDIGYFAIFVDTEGNLINLHSRA